MYVWELLLVIIPSTKPVIAAQRALHKPRKGRGGAKRAHQRGQVVVVTGAQGYQRDVRAAAILDDLGHSLFDLVVAALAFLLMAAGAAWTIANPARGPHDRIAGTWVVAR